MVFPNNVGFLLAILFSQCKAELEPSVTVPSKVKQFPHSVFLTVNCPSNESWICGATVLNQNLVLTAAHCLEGCEHLKIEILAGHKNLDKVTVIREVSKYLPHEDYDTYIMTADIAIAYLQHSLPLGDAIKRVIIMGTFPDVQTANVTGWGDIDMDVSSGNTPVELDTKTQALKAPKICSLVTFKDPGTICAGTQASKDGPFNGDSGGALITTQYQQIGLVSAKSMIHPGLTIYTNISYYFPWIQRRTKFIVCNNNINIDNIQ